LIIIRDVEDVNFGKAALVRKAFADLIFMSLLHN